MPTSSFAQSARQARQLDLLHVLQGFVLGVLQEISLALRMQRQTRRRESGITHIARDRQRQYCSCVSDILFGAVEQVQGPISNPFCLLVNTSPGGRDQSPFCSSVPSSAGKSAASKSGQGERDRCQTPPMAMATCPQPRVPCEL